MAGRKAIPNKIMELRGGTRHTHEKPRVEPDLPNKIPECPSHLNDKARAEWNRVVEILRGIGLITELDRATLAAHCEAYSRWAEAVTRVNEEGMVTIQGGIPKANPYIKICREAYDQMIKTGSLFGMSPSARASLSIANQTQSRATDKTELFRMMKHSDGK